MEKNNIKTAKNEMNQIVGYNKQFKIHIKCISI